MGRAEAAWAVQWPRQNTQCNDAKSRRARTFLPSVGTLRVKGVSQRPSMHAQGMNKAFRLVVGHDEHRARSPRPHVCPGNDGVPAADCVVTLLPLP